MPGQHPSGGTGEVPRPIVVTTGVGEGPTTMAAFDAALLDAGIANYNLIYLSSVIPAGSAIRRAKFESIDEHYGHRLYVVIARHDQQRAGESAWAGLGWTQEAGRGRGLFVEVHGPLRAEVEAEIHTTLDFMKAKRSHPYGEVDCEVAGIECRDRPVCALAVAVYQSQGWEHA